MSYIACPRYPYIRVYRLDDNAVTIAEELVFSDVTTYCNMGNQKNSSGARENLRVVLPSVSQ